MSSFRVGVRRELCYGLGNGGCDLFQSTLIVTQGNAEPVLKSTAATPMKMNSAGEHARAHFRATEGPKRT